MDELAIRMIQSNAAEKPQADDLDGVGPIRACVAEALEQYLQHLHGNDPVDLYRLVQAEVEPPMLEVVMDYCQGNQTRAAQALGINRATLRKKLLQYGLL